MKARIIVLTILINGICSLVHAQNDTTKIEVSEEVINTSDYKYQQKYKYLDINMKEESTLIKLGIPTMRVLSVGKYSSFNHFELYPGIETKISPALSIQLGIGYLYLNENGTDFNGFKVDIESRYYIKKSEKIQNNTSANNVNGSYIGLHVSPAPNIRFNNAVNVTKEIVYLSYGIQRRLNNFSYIDASIYGGYWDDESYKMGIAVFFGFGWGVSNK